MAFLNYFLKNIHFCSSEMPPIIMFWYNTHPFIHTHTQIHVHIYRYMYTYTPVNSGLTQLKSQFKVLEVTKYLLAVATLVSPLKASVWGKTHTQKSKNGHYSITYSLFLDHFFFSSEINLLAQNNVFLRYWQVWCWWTFCRTPESGFMLTLQSLLRLHAQ